MSDNLKHIIFSSFILLSLSIFHRTDLHGQNFIKKTFTTADGLPHNIARSIVRDSSGFIWVGTWDGLSRFDGHDFRNYYHIPGDTNSLPYFSVKNLAIDSYNNLWLHTDNGNVARFNRTTDNFTLFKSFNGVSIEQVISIHTDENGLLWIIGINEVIRWDDRKKEGLILSLLDDNGKPYSLLFQFTSLSFSGDSSIWISGSEVLEFRKSGKNTYKIKKLYPVINTPPKRKIEYEINIHASIYNSPSGNIWLLTNNGLFKLDKHNATFREYRDDIPPDEFSGKEYFSWGWPDDGIYIYKPETRKLTHIPGQSTHVPVSILPLDDKQIWFSSYTSSGVSLGISQLILTTGFFENYNLSDPDSAAPAVYSVIIDKYKNIWTGIRGYDHIVQFTPDKKIKNIFPAENRAADNMSYIRTMIPVRDGVWIGYFSELLQFYDYKTSVFKNYFPEVYGFRAILVNEDGTLFIGTTELSLFDPSTGKIKVLWKDPGAEHIFKLYLSPDGIMWGGMSGRKILKYNLRTGDSGVITLLSGQSNVEDIIPGDNGDLWFALLGEGVCRYNTINESFKFYTTASGLSNNTTYSLLRDKAGYIWVSTNNGISRINPKTDQIRVFRVTDGVGVIEFNSGAKFTGEDGRFLMGGMGGFVSFYPDSIMSYEAKQNKQGIIITDFRVSGGKSLPSKPLNESDTIFIQKGQNNFRLSFSSTDFINSDKTIFRYRLSGINREWIETDSENRNINYSNLNPGWYYLTIEATDFNGAWSASKMIVIRVTPYFYQTKLFLIMLPIIATLILIFSLIIYISQVQQKERQKQYELKLQSLRGQMNPHFIFNSLNSINYFISNNDKLSANRYIADFSRLIRSILSNMGNNYIPFESELSSIGDYLRIEHLRFGDKFDYKIITDQIIDQGNIEVYPGIVQPFIENAIWHGVRALENRKGMIRIVFLPHADGSLRCIIEDDGVGRKASIDRQGGYGNHKSRGIDIVTQRLQITTKIKRTNFKLEITDLYKDRIETGTKVEVDIPIKSGKE